MKSKGDAKLTICIALVIFFSAAVVGGAVILYRYSYFDSVNTILTFAIGILSLLISIIPIYRNSAALVSAAGEKADVNENIKEVSFGRLPEDGDVVSGRYLLEVICFLKEKYTIEISVEFSDRMYIFKNDSGMDSLRVIDENILFSVKSCTLELHDLINI